MRTMRAMSRSIMVVDMVVEVSRTLRSALLRATSADSVDILEEKS